MKYVAFFVASALYWTAAIAFYGLTMMGDCDTSANPHCGDARDRFTSGIPVAASLLYLLACWLILRRRRT
jgi:hypothetical protein